MPKVKLSKYGRTLTGEANCPPGAVKVRNSVRAASYCRKKPAAKKGGATKRKLPASFKMT